MLDDCLSAPLDRGEKVLTVGIVRCILLRDWFEEDGRFRLRGSVWSDDTWVEMTYGAPKLIDDLLETLVELIVRA